MTTDKATLDALAVQVRAHAKNLSDDIRNASTRVEHMRLTRLAFEALAIEETIVALIEQEE